MKRSRVREGVLVLLLIVLSACFGEDAPSQASIQHEALGDHECAVCGMSVAHQPAPRVQAVHRDGTRAFFCSIGDWQVQQSAPSPHGRIVASFVEVLDGQEDPLSRDLGTHPWVAADEASYVVGVERQGIMGAAVLSFREADAALAASRAHTNARVVDLAGLSSWWKEVSD